MANIEIKPTPIPPCPKCGGQPTLKRVMDGYMQYALCSKCGWFGDTADMEIGADSALYHWIEKVNYLKR